jgi:hypothetical protein
LLLIAVTLSAVEKDANTAVELKNGSLVGGRKTIQIPMHSKKQFNAHL